MADKPKDNSNGLSRRQPVVVVMGHVDHGKTTLLDYIRKANIADREAGGITQAIGAYEISHNERKLTFIDTPGHEAFTSMRSRGAKVADLAILVVAAEESVKPQTKEAIKILKETGTPFVVAITKIDKPSADEDRVKNDLMGEEVLLEGYGGQISWQAISAKTGEGVDELLDLLLLTADLEDITYDPEAPARGFVLETRTNKQRGLEATLIVRDGILHRGDDIGTINVSGKVKMLENFLGKSAKEIHAGAPALVVGFESLPAIGEPFFTGKEIKETDPSEEPMIRPEMLPAMAGKEPGVTVILVAGDAGSLEALSQVMKSLDHEIPLKVVSENVGDITESDVKLAVSGRAAIIGFKAKIDKAAENLAQNQDVNIITSNIIYDLIEHAKELAEKSKTSRIVGALEVLEAFNTKRTDKQVVGGKVTEGIFRNKARIKIMRDEEEVASGRVLNLQQQKKDAGQVEAGNEAGLMVSASAEIEKGDMLVIEEKIN